MQIIDIAIKLLNNCIKKNQSHLRLNDFNMIILKFSKIIMMIRTLFLEHSLSVDKCR